MKKDVLFELKKNYPKEYQRGYEKGAIDYENGFKPGYRRYKKFTQICNESLAYNDGFIDGYQKAQEEDVKLKTY